MYEATVAPFEEDASQETPRARILQASRVCFARHGFHGASMQQICAEARMSPGALYRYFPSKESIIEAIADEERSHGTRVLAMLFTDAPIVDRLVDCAIAYLEEMRRPGAGELMLEICSESRRNSSVGERFACIECGVRDQFRTIIGEAQARGEVTTAIDVDVLVDMLLSLGDGLVMRLVLDGVTEPVRYREALRRMLAGLMAP